MVNYKEKLISMPIFKIFDEETQKHFLAQSDMALVELITYLEEQTPAWQKSVEHVQKVLKEAPHMLQKEASSLLHEMEDNDKKQELAKMDVLINKQITS